MNRSFRTREPGIRAGIDERRLKSRFNKQAHDLGRLGVPNADTRTDRPLDPEVAMQRSHDKSQADLQQQLVDFQGWHQAARKQAASRLAVTTAQVDAAANAVELAEDNCASSAADLRSAEPGRAGERFVPFGFTALVGALSVGEFPLVVSMLGRLWDLGAWSARLLAVLVLALQAAAFHRAGDFYRRYELSEAPRANRRTLLGIGGLLFVAAAVLGTGLVWLRQSEYLESLGFAANASVAPLWVFVGFQITIGLLSTLAGYLLYSPVAEAARADRRTLRRRQRTQRKKERSHEQTLGEHTRIESLDPVEEWIAEARKLSASFAAVAAEFRTTLRLTLLRSSNEVGAYLLDAVEQPRFAMPVPNYELGDDDLETGGQLVLF